MTRVEAGLAERPRLLREQRRVRRQREIEAVDRREPLDEALELAPQERLAAGQADLLDPERDERLRDPLELLEREQLLAVHEAVFLPEHRLRHAVGAAEVAAVGDRDPQVADRPSERVDGVHRHNGTRRGRGRAPLRPTQSRPCRVDPDSVARCGEPGPAPGARRRHRDLGLHVRSRAERGRRLPALRVPRRPVRDLDSRPGAVRLAIAARPAAGRLGRRDTRRHVPRDRVRAADRRPRADDGDEHGFHHRALRRRHPAARARRVPDAGAAAGLARRGALADRAPAPERGAGRLLARQRPRARRTRSRSRCRSSRWSGSRPATTRGR